jgi:tetratricopeptide (TPR) repeat protein
MEYRLYIFLINYKYLQDVYKKDLDVQFENIKDFLVHELKISGYELAEGDNRSLTFKTDKANDFKSVFKMAKDTESVIVRLKSLLKEFEGELFIKLGIMTLEESDKRHAFKWSFSYDEIRTLPNILLTDKAAFSVIENFDVSYTGLKNIWTTSGVEVSRAQRIRKIYFNRDEENDIENFITKETDEQILFVFGDIGSGKSAVINEVVKRTYGKTIIHLKEKKHSTKEFKLVHELIFNLLFVNKINDILNTDEVISTIENSSLPALNKENLSYFVSNLYGDNPEDKVITFEYGDYRSNLKTALMDSLKITLKKCVVVIDDHQWMSANCEEMFLNLIDNEDRKIKLVFVSDDKNNSNNIKHPVKFLRISEVNKVQISKLLQMAFPHTKIPGKTADFIHKVTEGNLYTVISYVQYLIDKDALKVIEGKVELQFADPGSIPDNLSDIFSNKINSLSENALTMLKILSIIGEQFFNSDLDWLLHTLNYPYDEATALNELEEKGIIENRGDFYIITEPSVMNEIYKTIHEPNRKLIHKLLAELFETKGYGDFGFKVFFHLYRAENYEKLFEVLPELFQSSHTSIHFNALRNMLEISDKLLFKLCMKDNKFPAELWLQNLINTKWLFDAEDPIDHIKRFEKAIDYLAKSEKKELSADLYDILLSFYIRSEKLKKADAYIASGIEIAELTNSVNNKLNLLILKAVIHVKTGRMGEAAAMFVQIEELKRTPELSEIGEGDFYLYLKAMVLNYNNDTNSALAILKDLLDRYSAELNFGKINSILKLLIELSIKARDYRSAEEYCKFMLNSNKDSKDKNIIITGNILLAKLYSYQNKFLQSISMLESVIDSVKDDELHFSTVYSLGSIYQFYEEKEMALKTFLKAFAKIKDPKSDKLYRLSMKLSLISAYDGEYEQASTFLRSCKNCSNRLYILLSDIIKYQTEKTDDIQLDKALKELNEFDFKSEPDLAFETELILLKILFVKRKFIRCRELTELMNKQLNNVEDYNLTLEYQKLSKNIGRNTSKAKKNIPNIRKVSPSVKKRVRNRRSN